MIIFPLPSLERGIRPAHRRVLRCIRSRSFSNPSVRCFVLNTSSRGSDEIFVTVRPLSQSRPRIVSAIAEMLVSDVLHHPSR